MNELTPDEHRILVDAIHDSAIVIHKGQRMNERIQQLADNATHYANGVCDADANADWYETRDQKFAELIVKECIAAAEEAQADFYVINNIKTRFGVEE